MPTYKLYYFDAAGRGETARMLFVLKDVAFEDIRLGGESWQKAKPDMPMEQMPALEVDGELTGQSSAIYSYLAREFGLYGKDSMQTFKIDEIVGCTDDISKPLLKIYMEKDPAQKEALKKEFRDTQLPDWERKFEKVLTKYEAKYGNKEVTLAEICTYNTMQFFSMVEGASVKNAKVLEFAGKVKDNPKLAKYLAQQEAKK